MIEAINLTCIRQGRAVFAPISFQIQPGEMLFIRGANGSGKSSLLRLLCGILTPAQGDILWQGHSIFHDLSTYVSQLHYLGHSNGLKLGLSVLENLQLATALHAKKDSVSDAHTKEKWLAEFDLAEVSHSLVQYLSAGQKRRLALLKYFLLPKPLWILDEPLTSLDLKTKNLFLQQSQKHLQTGGMMIMSTHEHHSVFASVKTMEL